MKRAPGLGSPCTQVTDRVREEPQKREGGNGAVTKLSLRMGRAASKPTAVSGNLPSWLWVRSSAQKFCILGKGDRVKGLPSPQPQASLVVLISDCCSWQLLPHALPPSLASLPAVVMNSAGDANGEQILPAEMQPRRPKTQCTLLSDGGERSGNKHIPQSFPPPLPPPRTRTPPSPPAHVAPCVCTSAAAVCGGRHSHASLARPGLAGAVGSQVAACSELLPYVLEARFF